MKAKKQIIKLTNEQTDAYLAFNTKYQGKVFINAMNGLVIPKWDIFLRYGTEFFPEHIEIDDKPGWQNGKMRNIITYDEYLKEVRYDK